MTKIIEFYGKTEYFDKEKSNLGPLNKKAKKKLIKIIVDWTVREMIWLSLKDFPTLFEKIKDIFPKESMCMYFVPKEGDNNPSGPLYNAFRRSHQLLRQETGLRRNQLSAKKQKDNAATQEVLPSEIDVIRQRLISRSEPWNAIMEDWRKTFVYRRNEIVTTPLADVFNRWTKYKHKRGVEMVNLNFLFNS